MRRPVCSCERHELWNNQAKDLSNCVRYMNGWGGDQCVHVRDMNSGIAKPETLVIEWGTWTHEPCNGWGGSPFFLLRTSCCLLFFVCGWFCTVFFIRVRHWWPATKKQSTDITPVAAMQLCERHGIFGHICSCICRKTAAHIYIQNPSGYLCTFVHKYAGKLAAHIYIRNPTGYLCTFFHADSGKQLHIYKISLNICAHLFMYMQENSCTDIQNPTGYLCTLVHVYARK